MNWVQDKVLKKNWDASDDENDIVLYIKKHGPKRFSWHVMSDVELEPGADEIAGSAASLKEAQQMAEKAARFIGSDPFDWAIA